jgi:serine/threonine-protein kinase
VDQTVFDRTISTGVLPETPPTHHQPRGPRMAPMKKGRYEIRGKLGEGGMGVVFRAWDPPPMAREVAFKTLPAFPDRLALELFYKECSILKSMSHPNVVEIFDMGEFEEEGRRKPYFVMPLLPGQTLDDIIRNTSHRLTVQRIVDIISQTCRGLQAAHDHGLIHRDLKPSNIFVMADDSVKIIDFGVAHAVDVRSRSAGFSKGTLLYMAPEQVQHKPVSPQSDIFSLGVVCYEALTRRQPFRGSTEEEVVEAIQTFIPPPASDINPAVGQTISRVVHKAMAKQPWNRYDSVKEFGDTLQKALRNEPIELFDPARIQPRLQRASKALEGGDYQFAGEIVGELEAEGTVDPQLTLLRNQIDQVTRQRTIAQLLESARARYEEEEDPLALQKIQEVLRLDPSHAAALGLKSKIDERRSERQIEQWVRLARQHIDHHSYSPARDALQNVLALKPNDTRAARLLKEVEAEEQGYLRLRREKTEKYQAALNAWKNGEVSEALSQMKVVLDLDRRAPDSSSPETAATYQVFYNKVRSEHDAINGGYAEARRQLDAREFTKALQICQEFLAKYPGHALFQALKFDVEEQQRQELSAYIAEIARGLDAEADLDAKVSLLREAVGRYPDEPHFRRPLKATEDKRDLVNSIVARARVHEERGQISEALNDLEILQTIYTQYPGLKFEKERLQRRLEQQARQAAKAGWVSQIDRHLEVANYSRALELLDSADGEFPDDAELVELRKLALQGLERASQAEQLLIEGQDLCARGEIDRGIEVLTRAWQLDDRPAIRTLLRDLLVQQAQAALEHDPQAGGVLAERALELDPHHAMARSIRAHALDHQRDEAVTRSAAQARRLQLAGDLTGAIAEVENALLAYPGDTRLAALLDTLKKDLQSRSRSRVLEVGPTPTLRPSVGVAVVDAAPPEPVQTIVPSVPDGTIIRPPAAAAPKAAPRPPVKEPAVAWPKIVALARPLMTRRALIGTAATVVILVLALALVRILRPTSEAPAVAAATIPIHILSSPPGATIKINNEVRGTSDVNVALESGTYQVEATLPGYETATATMSVGPGTPSEMTLTLTPLLGSLRIMTSDPESSDVWLDDSPAGKVERGSFTLDAVGPGQHVLRISTPQQKIPDASIAFVSEAGAIPAVTTMTMPDRQAIVISSRLGGGRIQSSLAAVDVAIDGMPQGRLTEKGLDIATLETGIHELTLGAGNDVRKMSFTVGNAPGIDVILFSDRNVGSMLVLADQDDALVFLDGQAYPTRTQGGLLRIPNLATTKHTVRVVKDGFKASVTETVSIVKGQEAAVKFALAPVDRFASLALERMAPGVQVSVDDTVIGKVGADGRFSHNTVNPGRHTVQFTLAGHETVRMPREFIAGETVSLSDVALPASQGFLEILADATTEISVTRGGQEVQRLTGTKQIALQPASYNVTFQGRAGVPSSATAAVVAGESRTLDLRNRIITGLELFDDPDRWRKTDDKWSSRTGGGFVLYNRVRPIGRFAFTVLMPRGRVLRGARPVRWVFGYSDPRNYVAFQIDDKNLTRTEVIDGKRQAEQRFPLNFPENTPFIHLSVEVRSNQLVHQVSPDGKDWRALDTFTRSIADGKFGFNLPDRDDEISVSNFLFHPASER